MERIVGENTRSSREAVECFSLLVEWRTCSLPVLLLIFYLFFVVQLNVVVVVVVECFTKNIAQPRLLYSFCDKISSNFSILRSTKRRLYVERQNHKDSILTPSSHIIKRDGVVMSVIALNVLQAHLEVCRCNALMK